ncbi:MAG TPA: SH3 domain-containing protein [Coleofasciculaceae cyanobacterium]
MKNLLVLTIVLSSIIAGCQNSDVTSTSEPDSTPITQNSNSTPAPTTAQEPQSSKPTEAKPSTSSSKQVATPTTNSTSSQRVCSINAYVIDKDPQGLNVRSGPSSNDKIIGKLPTTTAGVFVNVTASQGDWMQFTKAESPEKVEFQGTGWVYASLLGTSTRGYGSQGVSVFSNPNSQSSTIGRIPPDTSVKLLGCDRAWALVEYQALKGWIAPESQCGNPLTTCP